VEKFELLYPVLLRLHNAGVLEQCVLVGSWCQDFYRHLWNNPFEIPAATTTDADLLIPRRIKCKSPVNIANLMEEAGFTIGPEGSSGLMHFVHEDFKFEFLTEPGAKAEEKLHLFKNLNVSAQKLHLLKIPLHYTFTMPFRDIVVRLPEMQAFALQKLIVSQRRKNPGKRAKDIATVEGIFEFIENHPEHRARLHEILQDFLPGWRKKVNNALEATGMTLP
jgi:hypothetical protein